tara:strand:+ start:262 stop:636 length:375 start_codon:yes stop_codon:yes gene_type:complete
MNLGAFSISLAVKNLTASQTFYEKLGFKVFAGETEQNWLILKNGEHIIGLFEGMFEQNIMTFNPGWDQNATPLDSYTDLRDIKRNLQAAGIEILQDSDEAGSGPASFSLLDPDGNAILIDQHVG